SPACLNHCATVASVTDSPSAGTLTSVAILIRLSEIKSIDLQRIRQKLVELLHVFAHQPHRRRRRRWPSGIARTAITCANLIQHPSDIGFHELPCTHILGLFLTPDDLGLRKA